MNKTKSAFALFRHPLAISLIIILLSFECILIVNFGSHIKKFLPTLQKLDNDALADIPHPVEAIWIRNANAFAIYPVSGAIITRSTSIHVTSIAHYRFSASAEYIEDYYIDYFSSQGWQMDRQKDSGANDDFSYEFHHGTACASLSIRPDEHEFSLAVWHDFWRELPRLYNLFGITEFLIGWQYIAPRCPTVS